MLRRQPLEIPTEYKCDKCGYIDLWHARCPSCLEGRMLPKGMDALPGMSVSTKTIKRASEVQNTDIVFTPSGIGPLDKVLGGGFPNGFVIQFSGPPGIGKSTILTQIAGGCLAYETLYIASEEAAGRVVNRAKRLGVSEAFYICETEDLEEAKFAIRKTSPKLVIVDSIAKIRMFEVNESTGRRAALKHTQLVVRDVATELIEMAKKKGCTIVMVCHMNKENEVAGLREVTHLVDVEMKIRGNPKGRLRWIGCSKNRAADTTYEGVFDMTDSGLVEHVGPAEEPPPDMASLPLVQDDSGGFRFVIPGGGRRRRGGQQG